MITLQIPTLDPFPVTDILHELVENFMTTGFANFFRLYRNGMLLVR